MVRRSGGHRHHRGHHVSHGGEPVSYTHLRGLVAIQDGARPFVSGEVITRALEAAARWGAAAPAVPVKDTIKVVDEDRFVRGTPRRDGLLAVQTPQVFDAFLYGEALAACADDAATDDCGVFEAFGGRVKLVEGDYANLKITTREDLAPYEKKEAPAMRVGHGYDCLLYTSRCV